MKTNSLCSWTFLFGFALAVFIANVPTDALAQIPFPSNRGATLQGELVPIPQTKSTEPSNYENFTPTDLEIIGPLKNQPRSKITSRPETRSATQNDINSVSPSSGPSRNGWIQSTRAGDRFAPVGDPNRQAAYSRSRRQDPSSNQIGDAVESLPAPLNNGQEGENVIIQRFPDGKPQVIRHVAQDEKGNYYNDGPWEARNQAGQIVASGTYVRGLMDGQWSRKHETSSSGLFSTKPFNLFQGPFTSVAYFKEGKLNGLWTIYDQFQSKIFEIPYKQGVREGTATWFYPNQAKMREASFKQGLIDGEIIDFDEAEKVVKRRQYVDGRPIVRNTTFYRPNVKKTEEYFLGKKLEPEDADDWWEAKPTPFRATGAETQNGAAMAWYENGQPKKRGQYKDGKPVGQFTWWHANGNKQSEGFYIDGKKSRRWTWWHENGMKQVEGIFENDKPIQIWRAWYPDGELRNEKDFSEQPEPVVVESSEDPFTSNSEAGENTADPNQSNPKQDEPSNEPALIGPTSEELPAPAKENNGENGAEQLESIDPIEFRAPETPGDPTGENQPASEQDEIGIIPIEIFESPGDPTKTDGTADRPKVRDKST